jgi:hypothetical protein
VDKAKKGEGQASAQLVMSGMAPESGKTLNINGKGIAYKTPAPRFGLYPSARWQDSRGQNRKPALRCFAHYLRVGKKPEYSLQKAGWQVKMGKLAISSPELRCFILAFGSCYGTPYELSCAHMFSIASPNGATS